MSVGSPLSAGDGKARGTWAGEGVGGLRWEEGTLCARGEGGAPRVHSAPPFRSSNRYRPAWRLTVRPSGQGMACRWALIYPACVMGVQGRRGRACACACVHVRARAWHGRESGGPAHTPAGDVACPRERISRCQEVVIAGYIALVVRPLSRPTCPPFPKPSPAHATRSGTLVETLLHSRVFTSCSGQPTSTRHPQPSPSKLSPRLCPLPSLLPIPRSRLFSTSFSPHPNPHSGNPIAPTLCIRASPLLAAATRPSPQTTGHWRHRTQQRPPSTSAAAAGVDCRGQSLAVRGPAQ